MDVELEIFVYYILYVYILYCYGSIHVMYSDYFFLNDFEIVVLCTPQFDLTSQESDVKILLFAALLFCMMSQVFKWQKKDPSHSKRRFGNLPTGHLSHFLQIMAPAVHHAWPCAVARPLHRAFRGPRA